MARHRLFRSVAVGVVALVALAGCSAGDPADTAPSAVTAVEDAGTVAVSPATTGEVSSTDVATSVPTTVADFTLPERFGSIEEVNAMTDDEVRAAFASETPQEAARLLTAVFIAQGRIADDTVANCVFEAFVEVLSTTGVAQAIDEILGDVPGEAVTLLTELGSACN